MSGEEAQPAKPATPGAEPADGEVKAPSGWGRVAQNRALKIMVKFRAGVRVKEAVLEASRVKSAERNVKQVSSCASPAVHFVSLADISHGKSSPYTH